MPRDISESPKVEAAIRELRKREYNVSKTAKAVGVSESALRNWATKRGINYRELAKAHRRAEVVAAEEAASLAQTAAAAPRPVGMRVSGVAGGSPPVPAPALPPRSAGQGHVRKEFWVAGDEASVRLAVLDLTGIAMVHGGSNLQFARLRSPLLNFATGIEDSIVQSHNFAFPSAERGSDFVRAAEGVVSTGIGHYSCVRVRIFEPGKLAAPTMAHDLR